MRSAICAAIWRPASLLYFKFSKVKVLPKPVKPTPMRRLSAASFCCWGKGHQVTSSTLSSMRTWVATDCSKAAKSNSGVPLKPKGWRTKRGRMMGPRSQQP